MPLLLLPLLWMLAELLGIILVAGGIGALATIALLLLAGVVGVGLIRGEQVSLLGQMAVERPIQPAAMREGSFRVLAGLLLIVPGFLSDALALVFLVPPLRVLLGAILLKLLAPLLRNVEMRRYGGGQVFEHEAKDQGESAEAARRGELPSNNKDE